MAPALRPQRALVLLDVGADALVGIEAAEQARLAALAGLAAGGLSRDFRAGIGAHAGDPGSRRLDRGSLELGRDPGGRNVGRAYRRHPA